MALMNMDQTPDIKNSHTAGPETAQTDQPDPFVLRYRDGLQEYLGGENEDALFRAYELGRQAVSRELGVPAILDAHDQAVAALFTDRRQSFGVSKPSLLAAGRFLREVMCALELSRMARKDSSSAIRNLCDVMDQEARRVGQILHDETTQILASLNLELAALETETSDEVRERVRRIGTHVEQVMEQLRDLSHELRPAILDELGLYPALRKLASGMERRSSLRVSVLGESICRLPRSVETVVYRVVQEALCNINKHAQASKAVVCVWVRKSDVRCTISDNGVGYDVDKQDIQGGLGLSGIQHRVHSNGGELRVRSEEGQGTTVQVVIPL